MTLRDFITEYFGTMRSFCEFMGVTYPTGFNWLKHADRISAESIVRMSAHTGVSEAEIIEIIKRSVNGDK